MIALPPNPQPQAPAALEQLGLPFGAATTLESIEPASGAGDADLLLSLRIGGEAFSFAAAAKSRSVPRVVEAALQAARRAAEQSGRLPMVVVPYLSERRLDELQAAEISGLDLCGNGLITIPGRILLRRDGRPNRYPDSGPTRFAYRGATSLVPRVFLRRTVFESVGAIQQEIALAGGRVALSTVSKALARMQEDLIIERSRGRIALARPDELLDRLATSFTPPRPRRTAPAKLVGDLNDLFARAAENGAPLVLSGASSQGQYAAGMRADDPVLYTTDLEALARSAGDLLEQKDRYANITFVETEDPGAFFDTRPSAGATAGPTARVLYASPVQSWLELTASGDKRDQDLARQVRSRILQEITAAGEKG